MTSPERILWIGGPTGSGKTTTARLLARRHGFRWHSSDTKTWDHRDRAIAAGDPGAIAWEALTVAERSALSVEEEERLRHDRGPLTHEDLAALPDAPAVVTDGTPYTPDLVGREAIMVPVHAVWLFAAGETRSVRNQGRGWGGAGDPADLRRAEDLAAAVQAAGGTMITTTDHGTALDTVAAIERVCADWLRDQPRASTIEQRRALIRAGNAAIVGQYRAGLARPWATTDPTTVIRAYDCECAHPDCTAMINLVLSTFPTPFLPSSPPLLASGHCLS